MITSGGSEVPETVKRFWRPVPTMVTLAVCVLLFALPVLTIGIGAFRDGSPGSPTATWTIAPLREVYSDAESWGVMWNSLLFAVAVSLLSTALAAYFAWLSTRTDTPLRGLISPIMVLVLVMPHLFFAVGWSLLGNEQIGGINKALESWFGIDSYPVNIETWTGIVVVATLKSTALKYMLLRGPMLAMDRSQEEAAFIAGASKLRTFLTVTLPALGPAITGAFILGVVVALEYFDIPLILGATSHINVFSTEIYANLYNHEPPLYGHASALAVGAMAVLFVLLILQARLLGRRQFATVRGKTSKQGKWRLGAWGYVGTAVIVVYALLGLLLPVIQLIFVSLTPFLGVYDNLSLDNYKAILQDPLVTSAIWQTIELAAGAGATAVILALVIAYFVRHRRGLVPKLLTLSTWLPWSVPGTALGLGMLWAYLSVPGLRNLYGTSALVLLGLVVAATPLAMRTVAPAVGQIGRELEEAGRVSGARQPRAFVHAVVRLCVPSLLAGWVLAAILVAGNLVIPLMLGSANSQTLPALVFQRYATGRLVEASALLILLLVGIGIVGLVPAIAVRAVRGIISVTRRRRLRLVSGLEEVLDQRPDDRAVTATPAGKE